MTRLNIVVPMAGRGSRFADAGYRDPKPLIDIGGRPMIQWVIENITPRRPHRFIFICQQEHLDHYPHISSALRRLSSGCEIVALTEVTEGAACTVLRSRQFIDSDEPLMIANSDQFVDADINEYLAVLDRAGADGLIMTFRADDPKWSYCRMRSDGTVSEVVEKKVISNEATVGIYNFARGRDFVSCADEMIERDLRVNGEFYVAPVYNMLIEEGARVVTGPAGTDGGGMWGLGTPADLETFKTARLPQLIQK